ncbi:MAG TPA: ShlB/FhaC/HecB family hemolysin secretion/activation protein [Verrucomicrobiae bacterium]|nr:ShlB/FhaC/HecB family hemolysin secretion/activation protein [Verrucomicrobiae bacterium]
MAAEAQETPAPGKAALPASYPIDTFALAYAPPGTNPHPDLPPIQTLMRSEIKLSRTGEVLGGPEVGADRVTITLEQQQGRRLYSPGALVSIEEQLAKAMNRLGFYGVWVSPDPGDINPETGEDRREGRAELRLQVYVSEVKELRSVAKGNRIPVSQAINNPAHRMILTKSPIQPPHDGERGSPFYKDRLDEYVGRLNRFPGRSVDASVASSGEPGGVVLDYLVTEDKPWAAYFQASNTGTEHSGEWRERFGFVHQQLTGHDDILSLDYTTANFDFSHAFLGSYEVPLDFPDRWRAKLYGSYSEFVSDELGLNFAAFRGSLWMVGGELVYSPWSVSPFSLGPLSFATGYIDLTGGTRWQEYSVDNRVFGATAEADLFLPYLGVSFSSMSQQTKLFAGLQFEFNVPGTAKTEVDPALGRLNLSRSYELFKGGAGFSFFLDPLFSRDQTRLIHEFATSVSGQYSVGDRLIPPQQLLIGGANSVRGYPEALDGGDSGFTGNAEYRLYLARLLAPSAGLNVAVGAKMTPRSQFGNPFRFRPRDVYGRPNWDLIFRTFVDGGCTFNQHPVASEQDRNLLSAGLGLELQVRRNLSVRGDYGFALISQRTGVAEPVDRGDGRWHFSAVLAW